MVGEGSCLRENILNDAKNENIDKVVFKCFKYKRENINALF